MYLYILGCRYKYKSRDQIRDNVKSFFFILLQYYLQMDTYAFYSQIYDASRDEDGKVFHKLKPVDLILQFLKKSPAVFPHDQSRESGLEPPDESRHRDFAQENTIRIFPGQGSSSHPFVLHLWPG